MSLSLSALFRANRVPLGVGMVLSLVAAGLTLLQPMVVGQVIDSLGTRQLPWQLVGALVALMLASVSLSAVQGYLLAVASERAVLTIRTRLADAVVNGDYLTLRKHRGGDLVTRGTSDVESVRGLVSTALVEFTRNLVLLIGATVALLLISPGLLGAALVPSGLAVLVILLASPPIRRHFAANRESVGQYGAGLEQVHRFTRIFRTESLGDVRRERMAADAQRHGLAAARVEALAAPLSTTLSQSGLVVVVLMAGYLVAQGSLTISEAVMFVLYLNFFLDPLQSIGASWMGIQDGLTAWHRLRAVADIPHESRTPDHRSETPAGPTRPGLRVEGLCVRYPGADEDSVHDLTFTIQPGERVALTGPSGAGKSTLLLALQGLVGTRAGTVSVDGSVLAETDPQLLRRRIGYVDQILHVWDGTVLDNLENGHHPSSETEKVAALRRLGLDHLTGSLDTTLGTDVELSTGEKQRVALARCLLRPAALYLLDEPTASLDDASHGQVLRLLDEVVGTAGLLMVTHDQRTLARADRVIRMEHGAVVFDGDPHRYQRDHAHDLDLELV